jgi:hypothetical protein
MPSRVKFFVWLILQNWVWTANRLLQRKWPNQYFCPLCIRNLETATHLLMECEFSKSIWLLINGWASLPSLHLIWWGDDKGMLNWYGDLSGALPAAKAKGAKSLIVLVCWMLWCERNRRIFDGVERRLDQLVAMIQAEARNGFLAGVYELTMYCRSPFQRVVACLCILARPRPFF